jgi:hypothetical protein
MAPCSRQRFAALAGASEHRRDPAGAEGRRSRLSDACHDVWLRGFVNDHRGGTCGSFDVLTERSQELSRTPFGPACGIEQPLRSWPLLRIDEHHSSHR